MTLLFNRVAQLTIQRTIPTATERRFFTTLPEAVTITDLKIKFKIKKTLNSSANTCEIQVYNLANHTRDDIESDGMGVHVELAAGYDDAPRSLFLGTVKASWTERDGSDWVTTMHVADGGRAIAFARVNHSYRPGTTVLTVLKDCARSMGLDLPRDLASAALRSQFASGFAMVGPTRDELTRLLAPFGYTWSIQNGRLQILRDEDTAGTVREISEATGMIGSPKLEISTRMSKKKGQKPPKLAVDTLLYPEIIPGGAFELVSRDIKGRYKVFEVTHTGDTQDNGEESWTSKIEARA